MRNFFRKINDIEDIYIYMLIIILFFLLNLAKYRIEENEKDIKNIIKIVYKINENQSKIIDDITNAQINHKYSKKYYIKEGE